MKKGLFLLFLFVFFMMGCSSKSEEEKMVMKCQKALDYELYSSMHIIGVFGTEKGDVTRIEVVENFTPKWDDVQADNLQTQLKKKKNDLNKKYEDLTFQVDTYKREVIFNYVMPLTKVNIEKMKKEEDYKNVIKGDLFSVADYFSSLEQKGYVCQ